MEKFKANGHEFRYFGEFINITNANGPQIRYLSKKGGNMPYLTRIAERMSDNFQKLHFFHK
uniref:Uncharacterized protein n=1 Tax=Anaerobacillus isosaccharinicus TaxID=1532552 RepID=A0A1S2LJ95_9BACI